jgi:hypothetical protein
MQVLYDSLESLAAMVTVDMSSMVRPDTENVVDSCGDPTHPYPLGDFNEDCFVDWTDFAIFADNWLQQTF